LLIIPTIYSEINYEFENSSEQAANIPKNPPPVYSYWRKPKKMNHIESSSPALKYNQY